MSFEDIENKLNSLSAEVKTTGLKVLAVEWRRSVVKNFEAGGRPAWTPRKHISKRQQGRNILVISGALKNVSTTIDESTSSVILIPDKRAAAYAAIHNLGGVIHVPARTLKFPKKNGRSVFASNKHKRIE